MEPFNFGVYNFIFIWGYALLPSNAQFQNMVCEKTSSRHGRQMTVPGPECDLSEKHWCTVKTENYPEEMLMEVILDNRGIMKRLFGDHREARFLHQEFTNNIYDTPTRPPPPLKSGKYKKQRTPKGVFDDGIVNGRFPSSDILATSRNGKKIDDNGSKMKVIQYDLFFDDVKKSKFRDEMEKSKLKSSTNDLTSRPNDKVFSNVIIKKTTQTTTEDYKTTESDLNETTITTTDLNDETTTIDEFASQEILTTESALDTESGKDQASNSNEEKLEIKLFQTEGKISEVEGNSSEASTISLDFGDEVVYEAKPLSPNSIKNVFRSEFVEDTEAKKTTALPVATTTSTSFLKGRVEFNKPTFPSPNPSNTAQNHYVRPEYQPQQQAPRTTPVYDKRVTPSREKLPDFNFASTNDATRPPPNYSPEKFSACNSTSEFIAPTWAKNIYGKNLIVINVGSFIQELHIQECEKDVLYRKMFCRRGCRCEQQYRYQKLLVIDPDDECRGIFSDWFRFPSCCVCVCYQRPNGMNRNARYMHEMDYDDEDYNDYLEDDLEDPSVRFYYGLDLIDKEEVWQDLLPSESIQKVYTSFTDIHSIDRSLNVEKPIQEAKDDNFWATGLNSLDMSNKLPPIKDDFYNSSNSSSGGVIKNKKSRLLGGFNRTVNVRPQIPPRRIPPPRASMGSYSFPWTNSPALSIWPSIAMYKQFSSYNRPNGLSSRSFPGDSFRSVTPAPSGLQRSTVGTLNAATPTYFDWRRRPVFLQDVTQNGKEKSSVLSRIPRSVRNRGK